LINNFAYLVYFIIDHFHPIIYIRIHGTILYRVHNAFIGDVNADGDAYVAGLDNVAWIGLIARSNRGDAICDIMLYLL